MLAMLSTALRYLRLHVTFMARVWLVLHIGKMFTIADFIERRENVWPMHTSNAINAPNAVLIFSEAASICGDATFKAVCSDAMRLTSTRPRPYRVLSIFSETARPLSTLRSIISYLLMGGSRALDFDHWYGFDLTFKPLSHTGCELAREKGSLRGERLPES
ncbi:uncharacterized protein BDR25DRAFT_354078 [Lindgomyces ingoldianus]|uniref:Uncharacterized protein n=1 Tax=Lindgomyces ingoldianus TaxID=673940 RepID=A0ACB6QZC5_9PLEO|nr:uncharacterized protein BDR25DRAFT_354078 [Lindgomyces ingoldianus]KAF2471546.1 hypothetical protein BDR25DRAFT_354078 [Lindgomyces ingoldianus]